VNLGHPGAAARRLARQRNIAIAWMNGRMSITWFLLGTLCVWRLTHLLVAEDGPWGIIARLRTQAAGGFWGGLLDCFYCLSLWIALPLALLVGTSALERLLLWPALSGGAILLERVTAESGGAPVLYVEDKET
jgi:hypothetical protein